MRAIKKVHNDEPNHWVGDGFYVKTVINHLCPKPEFNHTHTDPFLLLDYGEPTTFAPNPEYNHVPHGIGMHPHRGFETVTIAYLGEISHVDSTGGNATISGGDVQWMTAGRGILHEEFHSPDFGEKGGIFSMVQMWVNLPKKHKLTDPKYQTIRRSNMPVIDIFDEYGGGNNQNTSSNGPIGKVTLIAGTWQNKTGLAETFTDINVWNIELWAAGSTTLRIPSSHNLLILIQEGEVMINDAKVHASELIQFESPMTADSSMPVVDTAISTDPVMITCLPESVPKTRDKSIKLLLLSGEPIGEPIAGHGPFVMNTDEELKQTFHDYQHGVFGN